MEITYIYGKKFVDLPASLSPTAPFRSRSLPSRLTTAVGPLNSQSTEIVRKFNKWKSCNKRKSCLIRLILNISLFISKNHYFILFSGTKLFFSFSFLQTTKLNLKWLKILQKPWTNWLAPTMWSLVKIKIDLDVFFGPKTLSITCTWNSKCSGGTKTNNFDRHKTWQWKRQILFSLFDWGNS